jgi:hypothetical protein
LIAALVLVAMLLTDQAQPQSQATAAPAAGDLPEIGRVKSKVPSCVALQELVIPSFAAALRADKQFTQAAPQFASYAEAKDSATTLPTNVKKANGSPMKTKLIAADPDSATPEMYLARLDKALATMQQEVQVISKALGDPRIAADVTDPAVQSERSQLLVLYAAQMTRIATLQEFLERQRMNRAITDKTLTDQSVFSSAGVNMDDLQAAGADALASGHDPLLAGQPMINGLALNDKQTVSDWTTGMARGVHNYENVAAKTFLDIGKNCK